MERKTEKYELPSGITAEVITSWTFDEYLAIEAVNMKAAKNVHLEDGRPQADIDPEAVIESGRLAMRTAVKKLTAPDGADIPVSEMGSLDFQDGLRLREIVTAIDEGNKKK